MKNLDVVRNFCNGNKGIGSNLLSTGNELINYYTKIAKWEDGKIVLDAQFYSVTTSKIQNYVRRNAIQIVEIQKNLQ